MATKRKSLFLYLTLACFLGLIAIFVVDGYMGVYDTFYLTTGEYEQKIGPGSWLKQDRYVISNRYFSSTLAYQSINGSSSDKLIKFVDIFNMPKPDIIIFLKVSPETSLERKHKQKKNPDRFESDPDFLKRVDQSYDYLIRNNVFSHWYVIDGEKPKEEVFSQKKKILRLE